jgi:hypothetical protein
LASSSFFLFFIFYFRVFKNSIWLLTTRSLVLLPLFLLSVRSRSGKAVRLTYEHKGADEAEAKRIVKAGGFIVLNRVNGMHTRTSPLVVVGVQCTRTAGGWVGGSALRRPSSHTCLCITKVFSR